ncbi:hypothetical protein DMP17_34685 [Pseudonocardia sp. TMWB2A]|uniref:LAGLIDADG family homing endonuclease n=1 Tax=Pseudonocardia sp. TMWB2A TaxID=687430 RepID=UPI00307E69BE
MVHLDPTDEDHAYFLGLFQTDGHLRAADRNRGAATIELGVRDIAVLDAFVGLFAPGLRSTVTTRVRRTNFAERHESATWKTHAWSFRTELQALGLPAGRKSGSVAPPAGPVHVRGYLRGLVDGDGSVGFTARGYPFVGFTTASPALHAYFCAQVLDVTGVVRRSLANARDGVFNTIVMNEPAAALAEFLYPPGCLALPRKLAAAGTVARWRRPEGMRARSSPRRWTAAEDRLVARLPPAEAAAELGRTVASVSMRRWRLSRTGLGDAADPPPTSTSHPSP